MIVRQRRDSANSNKAIYHLRSMMPLDYPILDQDNPKT